MIECLQQDAFIHSMNRGINYLYFSTNLIPTSYGYNFQSRVGRMRNRNKHVVLEGNSIPAVQGEIIVSQPHKGYTKSVEMVYDLREIFKRENYENRKKYQNRVLSPRSLAKKLNIVIREAVHADLPAIVKLHDEWVAYKWADPKLHRMTFSTARYRRCVNNAFGNDGFRILVAEMAGEIVGCRVLSTQDDFLFDAAFFTYYWRQSQLSESINVLMLDFLHAMRYNYINIGISTGSLKTYKQQFPHRLVYVYRTTLVPAAPSTVDSFFE
jgi:hypothetical protein